MAKRIKKKKPAVKRHWTRNLEKLGACERSIRVFRRLTIRQAYDRIVYGKDWQIHVTWFQWLVSTLTGQNIREDDALRLLYHHKFPSDWRLKDLVQTVKCQAYEDDCNKEFAEHPWEVVRTTPPAPGITGRIERVQRRVDRGRGG